MKNLEKKRELYQAIKWEAEHYRAAHGMSLPEMWDACKGRYGEPAEFWKNLCLSDYREGMGE